MTNGELRDVFGALEEAFEALGVDYYLVGALAKEAWYAQGNIASRQTIDVDFAVLVGNQEKFEAIKEYLKEHKQFRGHTGNAFVMLSASGTQVDILPFGEIASMSEVIVQGKGLTSIKVDGRMEVYQSGTEPVETKTGHKFEAATLPAITLLKLIAFDDRPEIRQKDARDIADIITNFFDLQADLIYEQHNDLFEHYDPKNPREEISAIVIGREIKAISGTNLDLLNRLKTILQSHIERGEHSTFIQNMVSETKGTVEEAERLLQNMLHGLET